MKAEEKVKVKNENFEKTLFKAADKLRKNIDAAEYKNVVLGLIFLKYISQYNEELYQKLTQNSDQEIYIAGQALSHCVAKSTRQLVYKMIDTNQKIKNRVFLLENCMSNVPGFEAQGESFLKEMVDLGVTLIKI